MKPKHNSHAPNTHLPAGPTKLDQTNRPAAPSRDEVAMKAYLIYVNQGCPHGQDRQHWLEAEAQTLANAEHRVNAS